MRHILIAALLIAIACDDTTAPAEHIRVSVSVAEAIATKGDTVRATILLTNVTGSDVELQGDFCLVELEIYDRDGAAIKNCSAGADILITIPVPAWGSATVLRLWEIPEQSDIPFGLYRLHGVVNETNSPVRRSAAEFVCLESGEPSDACVVAQLDRR